MRILVAEDDRKLQRMLERGLAEEGYEVVAVGSAELALDKLRAETFDVCIMDIMLPGEDGLSALASARRL
ncbi:MAG TPA: response regulator, partial [Polyangia bacterium]